MRKQLSSDISVCFELLKIGRNSRAESGINAALSVALSWKAGKFSLHEAEILHLVVQNAESMGVREGRTSVN